GLLAPLGWHGAGGQVEQALPVSQGVVALVERLEGGGAPVKKLGALAVRFGQRRAGIDLKEGAAGVAGEQQGACQIDARLEPVGCATDCDAEIAEGGL